MKERTQLSKLYVLFEVGKRVLVTKHTRLQYLVEAGYIISQRLGFPFFNEGKFKCCLIVGGGIAKFMNKLCDERV